MCFFGACLRQGSRLTILSLKTLREVADMSGLARTCRRFRTWWSLPTLAMLAAGGGILVASPAIGDGGGPGVRVAAAEDTMIREAVRMDQRFVELWNANKVDEAIQFWFADDALEMPPNHEPIRGRAAILAYFKSLRDTVGELEGGTETFAASSSGGLVSLAGKYSARAGTLRFVAHETFQRQPDGSLKAIIDMFGFRDPMR
jgi:ketosteroid isomerase-like protein